MIKILFSPKSIQDINEIKNYLEEELCSKKVIERIIRKILDRIYKLADFPEIGTPLNSVVAIKTSYRYLVCENYKIFYTIENDEVHISRIFSIKRNYLSILFKNNQKP